MQFPVIVTIFGKLTHIASQIHQASDCHELYSLLFIFELQIHANVLITDHLHALIIKLIASDVPAHICYQLAKALVLSLYLNIINNMNWFEKWREKENGISNASNFTYFNFDFIFFVAPELFSVINFDFFETFESNGW